MDGFDVRGLEVGRLYSVSDAIGQYLIEQGYSESTAFNDKPKAPTQKAASTREKQSRRP
jgi:hypothetical protein